VNFVGKILGQGGENVKRLQEMTGCRIAVLGRGSMKDKNKVKTIIRRHQTPPRYRHTAHSGHFMVGQFHV